MPSLADHPSSTTTKLLLIGDSGSGKTGSLASLVKAGYKLRILDYDNGLDILKNTILAECPQFVNNIIYEPLIDDYGFSGALVIPKTATAFAKGMRLLDNWPTLGGVNTWDHTSVLVIDSLSTLSYAAFNHVMAMNGRLGQQPHIDDWGRAQGALENMLAMLTGPQTKCNLIIMAHIANIEDASGISKGYPRSLGKSLSPRIGGYFNTVLLAKQVGSGAAAKRIIRTTIDGNIGVKHSVASRLESELPVATALATFFEAARKAPPPTTTSNTK